MGRRLALAAAAAVATAPLAAPASAKDVKLQRDSAGVAHVTAGNWYGLGYGSGYGFAEDNLCVLADEFVTVNAERSRYFGPDERAEVLSTGADDSNLDSDFFYQRVKDQRIVEGLLRQQAPLGPAREVKRVAAGYAAGYNAFLRSKKFKDPTCKGELWVGPIEAIDVWRRIYQIIIYASGGPSSAVRWRPFPRRARRP